MNPNQIEYFELPVEAEDSASAERFMRELEAKERDLHITADTTFIEIADDFEEVPLPEYLSQELPKNGPKNFLSAAVRTPAPDKNLIVKLETEIAGLKGRIAAMEAERGEIFENSQRRSRDFEAYKLRTERERGETFQNQISNLAVQMLPAIDNLDRALRFASSKPDGTQNDFDQFFEGIVLVNHQINEVLSGMGIEPIATVGESFDPYFHEAVAIEESEDFPPNTISEEMLRGFRIGDKIIRHSLVKVSKPPKAEAAPAVIEAAAEYGDIEISDIGDASETLLDAAASSAPLDPANLTSTAE